MSEQPALSPGQSCRWPAPAGGTCTAHPLGMAISQFFTLRTLHPSQPWPAVPRQFCGTRQADTSQPFPPALSSHLGGDRVSQAGPAFSNPWPDGFVVLYVPASWWHSRWSPYSFGLNWFPFTSMDQEPLSVKAVSCSRGCRQLESIWLLLLQQFVLLTCLYFLLISADTKYLVSEPAGARGRVMECLCHWPKRPL